MTLVFWGSLCSPAMVLLRTIGWGFLKVFKPIFTTYFQTYFHNLFPNLVSQLISKLIFKRCSLVKWDRKTVLLHPMSSFMVRHLRWLLGPIWVSRLCAGLPACGKRKYFMNLRWAHLRSCVYGAAMTTSWSHAVEKWISSSVLYTKKSVAASHGFRKLGIWGITGMT